MIFIHKIFALFLLLPSLISSDDINFYNLPLGIPLNISNVKLHSKYIFNVEANYPKILRIKIIIPSVFKSIGLVGEMNVKELKEIDDYYFFGIVALTKPSIKYNPDESVIYLFSYDIYEPDTKFCYIEYFCEKSQEYFYIVVDLTEPYDLPIGITKTFYNVLEFFDNYFFLTGVERFQRINITMTVKGENKHPFSNIYISEYIYKTENYRDYVVRTNPLVYNYKSNYKTISEVENIFSINFMYDIERYPTVVLSAKFSCELYYLDLKVEAAGGEISFYDNYGVKNITNLKANYPYYFFSNVVQYQTVLITLITKYYEFFPFDEVKIYEYRNKNKSVNRILKNKIITNPVYNTDQLNISFSYQMNSSDITDIGFQFIPNFDLDYLFVKMNVMGGFYYLNDEDIKIIYNVYPGYGISLWIKSSKSETIITNLKYNYSEENPLNDLDIYEYNAPINNNNYYKHVKQKNIPKKINNSIYSTNFSYITENSGTQYVLLKINPNKLLNYLEIKLNTHKKEYDLINNTPIKINNINPGNSFYFFINANMYNKLFIKFIFNTENKKSIKYITVNEYEKRNDYSPIESTNLTFDVIKKENESFVELIYKPISSYSKYIAFILEANSNFDYLKTQVDIGGGYYEFNIDKNISKLIEGTVYYFVTKINPIQNLKMKIFIDDDNININPFTYANIYEKDKKEDISYNKYYNQSLKIEKIERKLIQYFSYPVDHFSTNYILIELIPNINLEKVQIKYEVTNIYNQLNDGESININKLMKNIPYYYFINSKQYQQIIFNITLNYLPEIPLEFIEIYEFSEKYHYNTYNKFTNQSLKFAIDNDEKIFANTFSYMIDSFYTNFIMIKIKSKIEYENVNIKINIGGGYYEIDKGSIKSISNLLLNYSYYFFVLSSNGDKLNIKLIINSTEKNNPLNTLNVREYSSKNSPSFYLQSTNQKFNTEIKDSKLIIFMSYSVKNNSTNFIALEMIPNYNLSNIECLIELEIKDESPTSFSIVKILAITLIGTISITATIFIIYIKKVYLKSSSGEIENLYQNRDNENKNEKKFELALLPIDPKSSSN